MGCNSISIEIFGIYCTSSICVNHFPLWVVRSFSPSLLHISIYMHPLRLIAMNYEKRNESKCNQRDQ
jgi:hypothetical protein